jgi:hypothetical protein
MDLHAETIAVAIAEGRRICLALPVAGSIRLDRKPYDEARYLMALQKRQAPLLAFAAKAST